MCRVNVGMWIVICAVLSCMPGTALAAFIPGQYTADANTVILYHMNENTGTTASDSAPLGGYNTGTLGALQPAWTPSGRFAAGLTASSGVSQYLSAPIGSGAFTNTFSNNQITLDAWIQPTGVDATGSYIAGGEGDGDGYMFLRYMGANQIEFGVRSFTGTSAVGWAVVSGEATGNLTGTGWHQVAGTFNNGTLNLYVDNVLIKTETTLNTTLLAPTNSFWVAGSLPWSGSTGGNYIGAIDEVRLSNIARTDFSVPEPSAMILLVISLVGLQGYGWRRRGVTPQ